MGKLPVECTNLWRPNEGERVYIAHAITKNKFQEAFFIRYWYGCLIIYYNNELHRLHVRHSGMKPVLNAKDVN